MGRKPCHDAGAVVRWMTTPGQHGEGPRLHVEKRRRHSRLGPHNKVVLGPSPLAGYSVGKCHSKRARHKGRKYFRGSGTTRATRPRQSAWSQLWALCGGTGLHSLPSVPQDWTFLFRLLCVHFFIQYLFSTYCMRGRGYGRHGPSIHLSRCSSGKDK